MTLSRTEQSLTEHRNGILPRVARWRGRFNAIKKKIERRRSPVAAGTVYCDVGEEKERRVRTETWNIQTKLSNAFRDPQSPACFS